MDMHKVHFRNEDVTLYVRHGTTLLAAARQVGIDPYPLLNGHVSCHGRGLCGTCLVKAEPDEALAPKGKMEAWRTSGKGLAYLMQPQIPADVPGLRLACRAEVVGEVRVTTSPDTKPAWRTHPYYSGRSVNSWEQQPVVAGTSDDAGGPA